MLGLPSYWAPTVSFTNGVVTPITARKQMGFTVVKKTPTYRAYGFLPPFIPGSGANAGTPPPKPWPAQHLDKATGSLAVTAPVRGPSNKNGGGNRGRVMNRMNRMICEG